MPKKLLLVEDEVFIAISESRMLERHGYEVATAARAEEAVAAAAVEDFDLILMDVDLGPGAMDGTQAAEAILEQRHVPIVFLSSHTDPEIVEKTEKITAYGYVVKNSGDTVLLNSIKMAFKLYEAFKKEHEQEKLLSAMISASPVSIYGVDLDGNVILWNESSERLFGWTSEEVTGRPLPSVPPEKREEFAELRRRVLAGQTVSRKEVTRQKKDGTEFCGRLSTSPLFDEDGAVLGIVSLIEDITKEKKAEQRERAHKEHLWTVLQSIGDAVITVGAQGEIRTMNPVAEELTGWRAAEAYERPLAEVLRVSHAETGEPILNPVEKALESGTTEGLTNDTVLTSRDGTQFQIADSAAPIRNGDGELGGVVMVFRDVSEEYRKKVELRERVKELDCLYAISKIVEERKHDLDDILRQASDVIPRSWLHSEVAACRITLHGRRYESAGFEESTWRQRAEVLVHGERAGTVEVVYLVERPERDEGPFLAEERRLLDAVAERIGTIAEQKHAESALEESELRWRFALDNAGDGVWDWDARTDTVHFSVKWKQILGYEEHEIGNSLEEWKSRIHPADAEQCFSDLQDHLDGKTAMHENVHRLQCKDGSYKWILDRGKVVKRDRDGSPLRVIGTHVDIDEHVRTKEHLQRALAEKQALMDELNHRTKNNLSLVASLIDLRNAETSSDLSSIRHQVEAVSLVHEKLHQRETTGRIAVREYLLDLLERVFASFTSRAVELAEEIEDVELPAKLTIPVGLLVNEIATNAIKHGFGEEAHARFGVRFEKDREAGQYVLELSNTGAPFPEDVDIESPRSLGLQLVSAHVQQLQGTLHLRKRPHPHFTIRFPTEEA
ncbi:MAG: PAS domain S-box protein [Spirochaetaceae bacterium]